MMLWNLTLQTSYAMRLNRLQQASGIRNQVKTVDDGRLARLVLMTKIVVIRTAGTLDNQRLIDDVRA